jgi:hypothetical protein
MSQASKPWYMLAPLAMVIILAVCWSGFWYYAFNQSRQRYDTWEVRARQSGLSLECAQQSWGGYPFRVEMRCDAAQFSRTGDGTDIFLASRNITALTQVYSPKLVVIQFTGPTNLDINTSAGGGISVAAGHDPALASVLFSQKTPAEISVLIENLKGSLKGATQAKAGSLTAKKLNLHGRFTEQPQAGKVSYDLAAVAHEFSYDGPVRDPIDGGPVTFGSFAFSGKLGGMPFPWPARLDETAQIWAENSGNLDINQLDLTRAPIRASMSGSLAADKNGKLSGKLAAKIVNLDKMLDRLAAAGKLSRGEASIAKNMFRMLSGSKDNAAISTNLVVNKSKIYLGPFKVGKIAPLF